MTTIVAFDFDGTLTRKDSFLRFISFCKGKTKLYMSIPYIGIVWGLFKINVLKRQHAKEIVFSHFFKGMPIQIFNDAGKAFSREIDVMLRPNVKSKISEYAKQGHKLVIISASVENWIRPWAFKNNIETVLGTQIEIDEAGLITGKFKSPNCIGKEKVNRLLEVFPNRKTYKLIAFGDSRGDKELMHLADESHFNYFKRQ